MNHEVILRKVQKLLALSSSDNEHEAATAAAKAQALLSQYNLSMSDIPTGEDGRIHADTVKTRTRQRLEKWAHFLAYRTARAFDCRCFHSSDGNTCFVGVGADPEVCAWTYGYLYKTMLRMGSKYLQSPRCRRLRSNRSKSLARESYLRGAVVTVSGRLQAQYTRTPVTQTALVPVKADAIRAAMPANLRSFSLEFKGTRDNDLQAGMIDGLNIPLSTALKGSRQPGITE